MPYPSLANLLIMPQSRLTKKLDLRHYPNAKFLQRRSLRLRQPDFLVLLLPDFHIVVQCLRDNALQEDALHEGNALHISVVNPDPRRKWLGFPEVSWHFWLARLSWGDPHSPCVWLPAWTSFSLWKPLPELHAERMLPRLQHAVAPELLWLQSVSESVQPAIPEAILLPGRLDWLHPMKPSIHKDKFFLLILLTLLLVYLLIILLCYP